MSFAIRIAVCLISVFYYLGCADKKFEKDNSRFVCQGLGNDACITDNGTDVFEDTLSGKGGVADIIFVDDNSGSMSFEQKNMADKFSSFISVLDQKQIDYRIGIITTDVSSSSNPARSINQNGELQDGKLVKFSDGSLYLTPGTANKESLFANAIKRSETLKCESFLTNNQSVDENSSAFKNGITENCPGQDERGIKASNLFIKNNSSQILRSNAPLSLVFLSDEDERSGIYDDNSSYQLETDDLPQTLIANVRSLNPGKTFNAYAIVVNPGQLTASANAEAVANLLSETESYNGQTVTKYVGGSFNNKDTNCFNSQFNQLGLPAQKAVKGSYGYVYALTALITNGYVGDICAGDYTSQLNTIASDIVEKVDSYQLKCSNPKDVIINTPAGMTYNISGSTVTFSRLLNPGETITIKHSCISL
jgi:hypothetical protein